MIIDLHSQAKQAHWNVKGPSFFSLHELFDKVAEELEGFADAIAERAVAVGGVALGTVRVAARNSFLSEYPLDISASHAHVEALSSAVAGFGKSVRKAIETATNAGDADTADLLTGVSPDIDKLLWIITTCGSCAQHRLGLLARLFFCITAAASGGAVAGGPANQSGDYRGAGLRRFGCGAGLSTTPSAAFVAGDHRFVDEFVAIARPQPSLPTTLDKVRDLKGHLADQRWLMIERDSYTGQRSYQWLKAQVWRIEPAMELDSFDAIVNLVSLGLGVSMVPHRVLPLYEQRRAVRRLTVQPRFSRDLTVVIRRNHRPPEQLRAFVASVLF